MAHRTIEEIVKYFDEFRKLHYTITPEQMLDPRIVSRIKGGITPGKLEEGEKFEKCKLPFSDIPPDAHFFYCYDTVRRMKMESKSIILSGENIGKVEKENPYRDCYIVLRKGDKTFFPEAPKLDIKELISSLENVKTPNKAISVDISKTVTKDETFEEEKYLLSLKLEGKVQNELSASSAGLEQVLMGWVKAFSISKDNINYKP